VNSYQLELEGDEHLAVEDALSGWQFIDNQGCSVATWLEDRLPLATSAKICVAYFTPSGLELIEDTLRDFLGKGGFLSIITSEEIS